MKRYHVEHIHLDHRDNHLLTHFLKHFEINLREETLKRFRVIQKKKKQKKKKEEVVKLLVRHLVHQLKQIMTWIIME